MADSTEQVGSVTTEKLPYRKYVRLGTDAEGKTVIEKKAVKSESDKKEPEKLESGLPNPQAGLAVSWASPEKEGLTHFNQNEFIRYRVNSWAGAEVLVPEEAQRVYIFQYGLNSLQTAKAISLMDELKDGESEPTPLHDGETIDLRDAINEAPSKRSTSDLDKFVAQADKLLTAMGVPDDEKAAKIAAMVASLQAATPTETE